MFKVSDLLAAIIRLPMKWRQLNPTTTLKSDETTNGYFVSRLLNVTEDVTEHQNLSLVY